MKYFRYLRKIIPYKSCPSLYTSLTRMPVFQESRGVKKLTPRDQTKRPHQVPLDLVKLTITSINSSTLRKIPHFHLISWCGNFAERHSFRRVSGESPKTM